MPVSIGTTDKKHVSALDIDQREWLTEVLDINNDEGLLEILEISRRYKKITQPVYSHFTHDALFIPLDTTGSTVTGSGTPTVTTTLTAGSSGFVRPTDLLKLPSNKVVYVTTVTGTPNVVTFKSVDGSNITHTAGQILNVFSGAVGEASKEPWNRRYGQTIYSNKVQIFREINKETDVQMASTVEVTWRGSHYLINRELAIKALTFKAMINGAVIGGEMSATSHSDASPALVDPTNGGSVQTTRGLDSYVEEFGVLGNVASNGTWTFGDLKTFQLMQIASRSEKDYMVVGSSMAMMAVSDYLKGVASGITQGQLRLDGKDFDFTVNSLRYGSFRYQFADGLGIFDHPEFFAQTDIAKSLYFIPTGTIKTFGGTINGVQPRIKMVYQDHGIQAKNRGNDIYAEYDTGALAQGGPTDSEHVYKTHWASHQGLEILGAQHFGKMRVLA